MRPDQQLEKLEKLERFIAYAKKEVEVAVTAAKKAEDFAKRATPHTDTEDPLHYDKHTASPLETTQRNAGYLNELLIALTQAYEEAEQIKKDLRGVKPQEEQEVNQDDQKSMRPSYFSFAW